LVAKWGRERGEGRGADGWTPDSCWITGQQEKAGDTGRRKRKEGEGKVCPERVGAGETMLSWSASPQ
jgi:hypothetical protein